jgi:hypothetical protein
MLELMDTISALNLFPKSCPQNPVYIKRQAWYRYAFYISTSALFVAIFWYLLISNLIAGSITETVGMLAVAGSLVAPLIPLLYLVRYLRSGICLTEEALFVKEGFFHGIETRIALDDIGSVEKIESGGPSSHVLGHLKITLRSGDSRFLLDVRESDKLFKDIRLRIPGNA